MNFTVKASLATRMPCHTYITWTWATWPREGCFGPINEPLGSREVIQTTFGNDAVSKKMPITILALDFQQFTE